MPLNHSPVHFVYVIECNDGLLYTGYATNVEQHVAEHDADEGAKYTHDWTLIEFIHVEEFGSKSATISREYEIKQLHRWEKQWLVESWALLLPVDS